MCRGTSGNFSTVLGRSPLRILITPSGADKGLLRPDDLIVVGADGVPLEAAGGVPSAETPLHLALASAAGAGAILHVHSVAATLLGQHFEPRGGFEITGYEMLKALEGVEAPDARVWVPVLPNLQDLGALARRVERLVGERPELRGFLLAAHGVYAWGDGLEQARRHLEAFEFLFECLLRRTSLRPFEGRDPAPEEDRGGPGARIGDAPR